MISEQVSQILKKQLETSNTVLLSEETWESLSESDQDQLILDNKLDVAIYHTGKISGYHITWKDNLDDIKEKGIMLSEDGVSGPGIYLFTGNKADAIIQCGDYAQETMFECDPDANLADDAAIVYAEYEGRYIQYSDSAACVLDGAQQLKLEEVTDWLEIWSKYWEKLSLRYTAEFRDNEATKESQD